ncbi:MAG TPA: malic enzyme-like NAD(P)-binding protein [Gammaproteobacteria bacterium]|nr:malic enzyme-like NAD(P)-binding protein [Gammaproteobacteria bacterium]
MRVPEILLIQSEHKPGSLAKILQAIGETGLVVEHLNAVRRDQDQTVWEVTLEMDENVDYGLYERIDALPNAKLLGKSDRVFDRHRGGKIMMVTRTRIETLQQLRDIYTPGVARVCLAIRKNPEEVWEYTNLRRTVGIITNGTAILGLGDIGPRAGLPVMEGKAALMAKFVGLSGIPVLLDAKEPAQIIETVKRIAPSFGAIQLEDIAAPVCFEVEDALRDALDMPLMHDDQHGTAVVTLAALLSATQRTGHEIEHSVIGQVGLGAAGIGIARLLIAYGVKNVVGTDLNPNAVKRLESMGGKGGSLEDVMRQADIVIATTGKRGLIKPEMVQKDQLILALSNPEPEIEAGDALAQGAAFAADGRSINNFLGFPGLFRGALDAEAKRFTDAMFFAAANKLAELAVGHDLVPDSLDIKVHEQVAKAVCEAAKSSGACD